MDSVKRSSDRSPRSPTMLVQAAEGWPLSLSRDITEGPWHPGIGGSGL
jgi:hypothetical protein